jgi:hypothetical protein
VLARNHASGEYSPDDAPEGAVTALIGLLGVVVGGLLGGGVTYYVERRKRQEQAYAVARLIAVELKTAARRLRE